MFHTNKDFRIPPIQNKPLENAISLSHVKKRNARYTKTQCAAKLICVTVVGWIIPFFIWWYKFSELREFDEEWENEEGTN